MKEAWQRFVFSYPRCQVKVRRTRTEKCLPSSNAPAVQAGGEALRIWGCIIYKGPRELFMIDGLVNSQQYRQILEKIMIPSVTI